MLFQKRFHGGLSDGSVTLTFRLWSKPQVKVGRRYRCHGVGLLEVDALDEIAVGEIGHVDARRAGFEKRGDLIDFLAKTSRKPVRESTRVYRVVLHFTGRDEAPSPGLDTSMSDAEVEALTRRLDKMDRLSRHGPWTRETLALIDSHPRVRAGDLAARLRRETLPFKTDVRKLKKLGLTLSFDVGYEISPRGRTYLSRAGERR